VADAPRTGAERRCLVVHPYGRDPDGEARTADARLDEAVGLARAIDLSVVHAEAIRVTRIRPATYLGQGAVERLARIVATGEAPAARHGPSAPDDAGDDDDTDSDDDGEDTEGDSDAEGHDTGRPDGRDGGGPTGRRALRSQQAREQRVERRAKRRAERTQPASAAIELAVLDTHLTPVQQRNLERDLGCKVIDRTGLILEIFGARARTREGSLQVELAALSYQRSRLVRSWTHLERQRGGFGFLGGPGETQIEADRRQIDERILRIRRDLADVKRTRALHRGARKRVPHPVIALVGYTNAGKSTLFNQLTHATALAQDLLFATLDPSMRGLRLPSGREAILSDTVGFISNLPHELVAAFQATLEEVLEADLIVHVRDAAHPDTDAQRNDVHRVLRELGLGEAVDLGLIEALNKIDALDPAARDRLVAQSRNANLLAFPVSALTGEGCDRLLGALDERLLAGWRVVEVQVPPSDGNTLAWIYRHGDVTRREDTDEGTRLTVRLAPADADRLTQRLQSSRP
jgi:GTP-binding protein HflX